MGVDELEKEIMELKMTLERVEKSVNQLVDVFGNFPKRHDPEMGPDVDIHDRIDRAEFRRKKVIENAIKTGSYAQQLSKSKEEKIRSLREVPGNEFPAQAIEEVLKDTTDVATRALNYLKEHLDASGWKVGEFGGCKVYLSFGLDPSIEAKIKCEF